MVAAGSVCPFDRIVTIRQISRQTIRQVIADARYAVSEVFTWIAQITDRVFVRQAAVELIGWFVGEIKSLVERPASREKIGEKTFISLMP